MDKKIREILNTKWAGCEVVYLDETDSTNVQARKLAEEGAPHGTLVVADRQHGGKGRLGRSWESPAGEGIWMSLILRPEISTLSASMLTLVLALAVEKGLRVVAGVDSQIKWPNDLILNGRKICGILTEMSSSQMDIQYVVAGIGINVSQREFPEELKTIASSLYMETGELFERERVVAAVMEAVEQFYDIFMATGDMSGLIERYNGRLVNMNQEVCVLAPSGEFRGISRGITSTGSLIVTMEDGTEREVISGEVSVRGVYGYV